MAAYLQSKKFKTDVLGMRVLAQADFLKFGTTGYEAATEGMVVVVESNSDPASEDRAIAKDVLIYSNGAWQELAVIQGGILTITAPEGQAAGIILESDGPLTADDQGDSWKIYGNDAGTGKLTFANDQASKSAFVEMVSFTANATATNSTAAFAGHMTVGHDLTVAGDLTINGTTTTINSTTLTVDDKNIELGNVEPFSLTASVNLLNSNAIIKVADASSVQVGATLTKTDGTGAMNATKVVVSGVNTGTTPHQITVAGGNNATAGTLIFTVDNTTDAVVDGGGITLKGSGDKEIKWLSADSRWHYNQGIEIDTGNFIVETGQVGIGTASPDASYLAEIEVADVENKGGLLIDCNETGVKYALEIDSEAPIYAAKIAGAGVHIECDITNASGLFVNNNQAEAGSSPLVTLQNEHASNTQTTLKVQQFGTGDILNLFDGNTEVVTVLDGGNVGIGVADPDSTLEVLDTTTQQKWSYDANSFATMTVADASHTTMATGESGNLTIDAAGNIEFNADGGTVEFKDDAQLLMTLTDSKVGIGTASPATLVHVNKASGENELRLQSSNKYTSIIQKDNAELIVQNASAGPIIFYDNSAETMRIEAGGEVGIGVSDPDARLEILSASTQLKLSNNADDYATFAVGTNGDLTITTVDANAGAANFGIVADGEIDIDANAGTLNLDGSGGINIGKAADVVVDIEASAFSINASDNLTLSATTNSGSAKRVSIDANNTGAGTASIQIGVGSSGTAISIGHTTSETTINDNLTVTGDFTVNGTTTTVNSTTVELDDKNIELAKGVGNNAAVDGGGITLVSSDGNKTINWVNSTGRWSTNVGLHVNSTDALVIPVGSTAVRPGSAANGMIRYNTSEGQYEGYGNSAWSPLGGVRDTDGDTYIQVETSAAADNDDLDFYTKGVKRLQIDDAGKLHFGKTDSANNANLFGPIKVWNESDNIVSAKNSTFQQAASWSTVGAFTVAGGSGVFAFVSAASHTLSLNSYAIPPKASTQYKLTVIVSGVAGTPHLRLSGGATNINSSNELIQGPVTNGTKTITFNSHAGTSGSSPLKFEAFNVQSGDSFQLESFTLTEMSTGKLTVLGEIDSSSMTIGGNTVTSIDSDFSSVSANHDTLASAKVVKDYVDSQVSSIDLTFGTAADSGAGSVSTSQNLTVTGGTGITTAAAAQSVTVSLSSIAAKRVLGNIDPTNPAIPSAIEIDTDLSSVSSNDDTLASAKAIKTAIDNAGKLKLNHVQNSNLLNPFTVTKGTQYDDVMIVNTADASSHSFSMDHPDGYASNARVTFVNASVKNLTIGKVSSPSSAFVFNCPQLFSSTQSSIVLNSNQKAVLIKTSGNQWDVIVSSL